MSPRNDVVGIALAGVLAWRPNTLDAVVQRPLLPLANRPWIEHFADRLQAAGIDRLAICVNRLSDPLLAHVRKLSADLGELELFVDGPPRGAAGCARDVAEQMPARAYLVVESVVVPCLDLDALLHHHDADAPVATVVVNDGGAQSVGEGQLTQPIGVHVVGGELLRTVPASGYQDLKEVLINRSVRAGGRVGTYRSPVANPRITDLQSYLVAHEWILSRRCPNARRGGASAANGSGEISVSDSAEVSPSARLVGPVLVGDGSSVGPGATIIGPCAIGGHCVVRENAIVCESVLWDNCVVEPGAIVTQCVLVTGTIVRAAIRKERELLLGTVAA